MPGKERGINTMLGKFKARLHTLEIVLAALIDELVEAGTISKSGLQKRISQNNLKDDEEE